MKFVSVFAVIFSLCVPLPAFSGQTNDPALLTELLKRAEENNPLLLAAEEQIQVAAAQIDQASALPDPQLSISLLNYPVNNLSSDTSPMTGNDFKLSQMLPFSRETGNERRIGPSTRTLGSCKTCRSGSASSPAGTG